MNLVTIIDESTEFRGWMQQLLQDFRLLFLFLSAGDAVALLDEGFGSIETDSLPTEGFRWEVQ